MRTAILFLLGCSASTPVSKTELGRRLFEDAQLSEPAGQACADCHDARIAFADPEGDRTSVGVVRGRFGPRNAPTLKYAALIPPLHRDGGARLVGGLFWDGRVNTLAEQAAIPFLNPLEMNNASRAQVVAKLRARHARAMKQVFGANVFDDEATAFARACEAIAAFEAAPTFAPFTSKYDRFRAGTATLAPAEARGLAIFLDPARGNCASCHRPPLFTDHSYVDLGVPRFADNPFYELPPPLNPDGPAYVDRGLATTTGDPRDEGAFRVPTLRNVALTSPYAHNGYFRRLDEVITFHAPALSRDEVRDLVAFLGTLTD